jgi:hypothetical protein
MTKISDILHGKILIVDDQETNNFLLLLDLEIPGMVLSRVKARCIHGS